MAKRKNRPGPLLFVGILVGLVLVARWALAKLKRPMVKDDGLVDDEGVTVGDADASLGAQRQQWAQALGVPEAAMAELDDIEATALANGAPEDWEFGQNWPTPCGPASSPYQHCSPAEVLAV